MTRYSYQEKIIDAIKRSDEKMETHSKKKKADEKMDKFDRTMENYSKKTDEKMDTFLQTIKRYSRNTAPWDELNHCENERRRR